MVSVVRPRCHGVCVKSGKPCGNWKELNADGFCKFHVPNALQCRGIAKSTGVRCRIKWDLNDEQFCCFHVSQASRPKFPKDAEAKAEKAVLRTIEKKEKTMKQQEETATQCAGIAKSTGVRCRIWWKLGTNGYCHYHQHQAPPTEKPLMRPAVAMYKPVQCHGIAKSTGVRCRIYWDLNNHGYCDYHKNQRRVARL